MPDAPESAKRSAFNDEPAPSPADAFNSAAAHLAEIRGYVSYYLSAKLDSYLSSAKSAVHYGLFLLLAGFAAVAILATAGVLVALGISEGLTVLFGGRVWLADLVTGLVILGSVLGTTYVLINKLIGTSRAAVQAKYEALNREQFAKHGHNVHERSSAQHR